MSNEIKRMRYFNGLLLKDDDLELEQDYHIKMHRLHNYYFHNCGIVEGLEVEAVEKAPMVRITKGLALNKVIRGVDNEAQSQEIWIYDTHPDNPVNLSSYGPNENIYITVSYKEIDVDIDATKGGENKIHVWERSVIEHSRQLPKNPEEKIILARVILANAEDGGLYVKTISSRDENNITELRNYAKPSKKSGVFEKLSIGDDKNKNINLPYMEPLVDDKIVKGIEVHSSLTKFSGDLESGGLKADGDVDIKGVFTVTKNSQDSLKVDSKGNTEISNSLLVKDKISVQNGMYIGGDNINIDTSNVLVTSNTLKINNNDGNKDEKMPKEVDSGLEICRVGAGSNAKLIWSEKEKIWKAGIEGTKMYPIAYGQSWEDLHKGGKCDNLHKHSQLSDEYGNVRLSVDKIGDVDIPQSMVISGKVFANGGIEVTRPKSLSSAKLAWNEDSKHWQVEDKEEMVNLIYGREWNELIDGINVDSRHNHSRLYTEDGKALTVRVNPNGNVDIASDLTVGKNLTVVGDFTVKGRNSVITTEKLEVADNVIVVNTHQNGEQPVSQSGIEVYRGGTLDNARIIWDEGSKKWKIGIGKDITSVPCGNEWEQLTNGGIIENLHRHDSLYSKNGNEIFKILSDKELEADSNLSITGELNAEKDVKIKGEVKVSNSMTVEGNLTVNGTTTVVNRKNLEVDDNVVIVNRYPDSSKPFYEGGLEVYRGGVVPNAKILWNEKEKKWKFGVGDDIVELPNAQGWQVLTSQGVADKLHKHSVLYDSTNNASISANNGKIDIKGNTKIEGDFCVDGPLNVSGDLDVKGTITSVNKVDMKVTDNFIILNNFEGDNLKLNESGIEVFRGKKKDKARIVWDESVSKWKLGVGEELKDILCGDQWNKLISGKNADGIHLHGQLYNSKGDILGLSVSGRGDVDVSHGLSVTHDLTVLGNVEVKGSLASFNTDMFEIRGNSIIVNRYETDSVSGKAISGLKVFRGNNNSFAGVMWDEIIDSWKIGLLDGKESLVINKNGDLTALGKIKANSAEFNEDIKGANGEFTGNINVENANIKGNLVVKNGIEVKRLQERSAYVKWSEESKHWNIGTAGKTGIIITEDGKVEIGDEKSSSILDVKGDVTISKDVKIGGGSTIVGKAVVADTITAGKNVDVVGDITCNNATFNGNLKVKNNIISGTGIEIFRGDGKPSAKINWEETDKSWYFSEGDKQEKIMLSKHNHDKLYNPNGDDVSVFVNDDGYVGIGTNEPKAKLHVEGDFQGKNGIFNGNVGIGVNEPKAKLHVNDLARFDGDITSKGVFKGKDGEFSNDVKIKGNVGIGVDKPLAKLHVSESGQFDGNITANGNIISKNGSITGKDGVFKGDLSVNGNIMTGSGIEVVRVDEKENKLPSAKLMWSKADNAWLYGVGDNMDSIVGSKHKHNTLCDSSKEEKVSVTVNDKGNVGIGIDKPLAKLHVSESAQVDGNITLSGDVTSSNGCISGKDGVFKGNLSVNGNIMAGSGIEVVRVDEKENKLPSAKIAWDKVENTWVYGVGNEVDKITGSKHKHNTLYDSSKEEKASVTVNDKGNVGIGIDKPLAKLHVSESAQIDGNITLSGDVTSSNGSITGKDGVFKGNLSVNGNIMAGSGIEVVRVDEKENKLPSAKIAWDKVENTWVYGVGNEVDKITGSKHKHNTLCDSSKEEKISVTVNDKGNVGIGIDAPSAKLHVNGDALFNDKITGKSEMEIGASALIVTKDGNVGIGKNPDSGVKLDIDGVVRANNLVQRLSEDDNENIKELQFEKAIGLLNGIKAVSYNCKADVTKKQNIGFIIEAVSEIFPVLDKKSVPVMDIIGVLAAVVKNQNKQLENLYVRVNDLEQKIK